MVSVGNAQLTTLKPIGHILDNDASPSQPVAQAWRFGANLVIQMHRSSDHCKTLSGSILLPFGIRGKLGTIARSCRACAWDNGAATRKSRLYLRTLMKPGHRGGGQKARRGCHSLFYVDHQWYRIDLGCGGGCLITHHLPRVPEQLLPISLRSP